MGNEWIALGLTIVAGLATAIGSLIAFLSRRDNPRFLSMMLGFSAGVMIYISLVEIFPKALETLTAEHGEKPGAWLTAGAFFAGIALIAIIDRLVPTEANPHELSNSSGMDEESRKKLMRMGMVTALAIAIHNFPEGFATFIAALSDPEIAIPIVVAIALHNIPEGIAVSAPIYYATGSRKKAFWLSAGSGLAEPLGAIIGYVLLAPFMSDTLLGLVFASIAGVMVFISLDELLPSAEEYGEHHVAMYSLIIGMVVTALSLLVMM